MPLEHLPPHHGKITRVEIQTAWDRHGGNVREVFFELYNLFEERRADCKNYNGSPSDSYTIAWGAVSESARHSLNES